MENYGKTHIKCLKLIRNHTRKKSANPQCRYRFGPRSKFSDPYPYPVMYPWQNLQVYPYPCSTLPIMAARCWTNTTAPLMIRLCIILQCVSRFFYLFLSILMLYLVLHPHYKSSYFHKANWPHAWIATAEEFLWSQWEKYYKPLTLTKSPTQASQLLFLCDPHMIDCFANLGIGQSLRKQIFFRARYISTTWQCPHRSCLQMVVDAAYLEHSRANQLVVCHGSQW